MASAGRSCAEWITATVAAARIKVRNSGNSIVALSSSLCRSFLPTTTRSFHLAVSCSSFLPRGFTVRNGSNVATATRQLHDPAISHHHPSYPPFSSLPSPSSTSSSLTISKSRLIPSLLRPTSVHITQKRYCSFRRSMCRHLNLADGAACKSTPVRQVLPTDVKPLHYNLTLEPNLDTQDLSDSEIEKSEPPYEGTVAIDLKVINRTKSISLNTVDIDIHETTVTTTSKDGSVVVLAAEPALSWDKELQITTITLGKELEPGSNLTLTQKFSGKLNSRMAGFYRSTYKKKDGSTGLMATTQMEPVDARRAFPCFDEPALKAKFTVTLIADPHFTCLSNMDVASEKKNVTGKYGKGKSAYTFNTTPLMSTYLLAFIVGELNYVETNAFRIPIRVYAPPSEDIEHGRFSLKLAAQTLAFYEDQFASEFPLPKMDMVAIPDFSAGAMENWGLVTYRVVDLMLNPDTSSAAVKQRVAEVVQHELAHQWFGNLVTMDWWDGLWLNEGFATWMSWHSCHNFFPEWKVWETYVVDSLQSALSLDSLRSSHPVEVPLYDQKKINQIFDSISYAKGSCVLRMISTYLKEGPFIEGVRRYIAKHAYGNTETNDLWAALGGNVEADMGTWTRKIGYPVITVTENEDKSSITVRQNRYLRTNDVKPAEDETLYPVFLALRTKDGVDNTVRLDTREKTIPVEGGLDFFKLNANHTGIYRTAYSTERLVKLAKSATEPNSLLTVEDRAGMISDAGALAASGHSPTDSLLSFLQLFDKEDEYIVWDQILGRVDTIRHTFLFAGDDALQASLNNFKLDLVSKRARELGWEFEASDSHILQQYKSLMFVAAGLAGDEKIKDAAFEMFKKFKAGDRSAINPNIRSSVYNMVLKYGGDEEYDWIRKEGYNYQRTSDERNSALRCLGQSRSEKNVRRTLELALSEHVKSQDIYLPLVALRVHKVGTLALWQWFVENWDGINKKLGAGLDMLGTIVRICSNSLATQDQLDEVNAFFDKKDTKGYQDALDQTRDVIQAKIAWTDREVGNVRAWLKANKY